MDEAEERRQRILEAAAKLELFRQENGHDPATADELRAWLSRRPPEPAVEPAAVLTREQMLDALRDCLRED